MTRSLQRCGSTVAAAAVVAVAALSVGIIAFADAITLSTDAVAFLMSGNGSPHKILIKMLTNANDCLMLYKKTFVCLMWVFRETYMRSKMSLGSRKLYWVYGQEAQEVRYMRAI